VRKSYKSGFLLKPHIDKGAINGEEEDEEDARQGVLQPGHGGAALAPVPDPLSASSCGSSSVGSCLSPTGFP